MPGTDCRVDAWESRPETSMATQTLHWPWSKPVVLESMVMNGDKTYGAASEAGPGVASCAPAPWCSAKRVVAACAEHLILGTSSLPELDRLFHCPTSSSIEGRLCRRILIAGTDSAPSLLRSSTSSEAHLAWRRPRACSVPDPRFFETVRDQSAPADATAALPVLPLVDLLLPWATCPSWLWCRLMMRRGLGFPETRCVLGRKHLPDTTSSMNRVRLL
jgi:hypothetical protein